VINDLRELCFWYELSAVPSHQVIAQTLQDAADALQCKALSPEAAQALITVWQPFVGREAAIGDPPTMMRMQDDTIGVLEYAVKDLGRLLDKATDDDKPRIAARLCEQVAILEKHKGMCDG
jgi:hypothetical protein